MASATLAIQGMSCSHCVMAVQKALAAVPGVGKATVTLTPARARVEYDDAAASIAALLAAVEKAGYSATPAG